MRDNKMLGVAFEQLEHVYSQPINMDNWTRISVLCFLIAKGTEEAELEYAIEHLKQIWKTTRGEGNPVYRDYIYRDYREPLRKTIEVCEQRYESFKMLQKGLFNNRINDDYFGE